MSRYSPTFIGQQSNLHFSCSTTCATMPCGGRSQIVSRAAAVLDLNKSNRARSAIFKAQRETVLSERSHCWGPAVPMSTESLVRDATCSCNSMITSLRASRPEYFVRLLVTARCLLYLIKRVSQGTGNFSHNQPVRLIIQRGLSQLECQSSFQSLLLGCTHHL